MISFNSIFYHLCSGTSVVSVDCCRGSVCHSLHLKVVQCFTAECQLLTRDGPPATQIKAGEPWLTASLRRPLNARRDQITWFSSYQKQREKKKFSSLFLASGRNVANNHILTLLHHFHLLCCSLKFTSRNKKNERKKYGRPLSVFLSVDVKVKASSQTGKAEDLIVRDK